MVFSVAIGVTGMYTFRLNPHLPVADRALPWLVMHVLPPWLAALVVVAVISGISSATTGTAAAAGTFFVRHIYPLVTGRYPKQPVSTARYLLVFAFLFATALALYTGSIVGFVIKFLPLTMSGLGVIILLGRFWKRATWQGALAALVTTPVVSLVGMGLEHPTVAGHLGRCARHGRRRARFDRRQPADTSQPVRLRRGRRAHGAPTPLGRRQHPRPSPAPPLRNRPARRPGAPRRGHPRHFGTSAL